MKNIMLGISTLFLLISGACRKSVDITSVFNSLTLSTDTAIGDGSQLINIVCEINSAATEDRWEFILKTSMGQYTENKESKLVKKPEFKNGKLLLEAVAQVPLSSGTMLITVEPNQPAEKRDFIIKDSVILTKSEAGVVKLASSALGIGSDAQSELQLSASVFNASGGKASQGTSVLFEDFLIAGSSAGGRFSERIVPSGADAKATTNYAAGDHPVGTDIYIVSTILDTIGNRTSYKDTVTVKINL